MAEPKRIKSGAVSLRKYVDNRFTLLENERSSWTSHWRDLSKFIEPRIGRFLISDNNKGSKRNGAIINSTATFALRVGTAGLMTGLTSQSRPWFGLSSGDAAADETRSVRMYHEAVRNILMDIFAQSNVYQSLSSVYEESLLIGTAAMLVEEDFVNVIRTKAYTAGQYMFAIGADGRVNTVYREWRKTVEQLVDEFGYKNCSDSTRNQWDNEQFDHWVDVRMGIEPNKKRRDGSKLAKDKPIASYHWEVGASEIGPNEGFLRRSGFDEFPLMGPRWNPQPNDVYGRSPAMDILGDVRQLQQQERDKATAIAKMYKPPVTGDANLRPGQINTHPDGFTPVNNVGGQKTTGALYTVNLNVSHLVQDMERVEARIKRGMYEDLFLAITNLDDVRTATEIIERKVEKMTMLGPVIERLEVELLDPLISRTFAIAERFGLMPEPPEELQSGQINIDYVSPLALAARAVATGNIERLGAYIGAVSQLDPSAVDKFNTDVAIDNYAKSLGSDPTLIRGDDEVAAIRQARTEKQQQAEAVSAASGMVDSAKTLSEIDPAGNAMVNQILGNVAPS